MSALKVAELFAGIGGVTGGLLDAGGFEPVLLIDSDPQAAVVFEANFPSHADCYHTRLVGNRLTAARFLELAGGNLDGILGCPPCQGFSAAGLRDRDDDRNALLGEMRRLIRGTEPLFFLVENVPGLLGSQQYKRFVAALEGEYEILAQVLNAAEYGIPQLRRRLVVFGIRRDAGVRPSLPPPTCGGDGRVFEYCSGRYLKPSSESGRRAFQLRPDVDLPGRRFVTLEQALGDLRIDPPVHDGSLNRQGAIGVRYVVPAATEYQKLMRRGCSGTVTDHVAWRHRSPLIRRLRSLRPGDCPVGLGDRGRNIRYFSQAYARLHPKGLARTITTNFHNPGAGRFTHYAAPRALTLREALRLQGFRDEFSVAQVTLTDAERLIGNAFPRRLAEILGRHIARLFSAGG